MIVADASAVVSALLRSGMARERLAHDSVHAPHHLDLEVLEAVRKLDLRNAIDAELADQIVRTWPQLGVVRHPMLGMIPRVWELRTNVTAYDAAYVALAETLECTLVTADARLANATGPRCPIEVVPR